MSNLSNDTEVRSSHILIDTNTSKVYELKVFNNKLMLEEILSTTYSYSICLLDETSSLLYELRVTDGKLIMEEVALSTSYHTLIKLLDAKTAEVYELRVVGGNLILEDVIEAVISEVDLLSYWMPFLRNLKVFKEIAKAEEPEIILLLRAIERSLSNMYIDTADEYGISRFEDMMRIDPEDGDTLEDRRFRVQAKWNDNVSYTEAVLKNQLNVLCGENGYSLSINYAEYKMEVKLALSNEKNMETVRKLLDKIVPANMITSVTMFNTHSILTGYTQEHLANFTQKEVREDIL